MKKIYSSYNRVMLYLLKAKLEEQKIFSIIKNEELAGPAAGEVPPVVAKPELWIFEDEQYSLANNILQEELAMQANPAQAWHCPQCQEEMEGQFDVCWKCGHSRAE